MQQRYYLAPFLILISPFLAGTIPAGEVNGRWAPGIGDPTLLGWCITLGYFATAALSLRTMQRQQKKQSKNFWAIVGILMLIMGFNKQLDLQTLIIQTGKDLSKACGIYDDKIKIQVAFILLFSICGFAATAGFFFLIGKQVLKFPFAIAGIILLVCYVIMRAGTMQQFEILPDRNIRQFQLNQLLEIVALGSICLGAIINFKLKLSTITNS